MVGTVTYMYNGVELVTLNAVAMSSIESDSVKAWLDNAKNFLFGTFMKTVLWIIGIIVVAYVVVSIVGVVYRFVNGVRPDQTVKRKKKPAKKPQSPKRADVSDKTSDKVQPKREKAPEQPKSNEEGSEDISQ